MMNPDDEKVEAGKKPRLPLLQRLRPRMIAGGLSASLPVLLNCDVITAEAAVLLLLAAPLAFEYWALKPATASAVKGLL